MILIILNMFDSHTLENLKESKAGTGLGSEMAPDEEEPLCLFMLRRPPACKP